MRLDRTGLLVALTCMASACRAPPAESFPEFAAEPPPNASPIGPVDGRPDVPGGADDVVANAEETDQAAEAVVGQSVPTGDPPPDAVGCSIVDSNGPFEGGTETQQGCLEGEQCICVAQAGYSCSGFCARDGRWVARPAVPPASGKAGGR